MIERDDSNYKKDMVFTPLKNIDFDEQLESFGSFVERKNKMYNGITHSELKQQYERRKIAHNVKNGKPTQLKNKVQYFQKVQPNVEGNREDSIDIMEQNEFKRLEQLDFAQTQQLLNQKKKWKTEENLMMPRMIIQKVVLENFKSYADRIQVVGLRSGFNGIIGPNGSGKSNFIDALLFALGYNAKWMRMDKIKNLIHHSDHRNPKKGFVQIHFTQSQRLQSQMRFTTITPGTKLVLKRTVYENNTSSYQLNGRSLPFKQIKDIFIKKGIDLHHHKFLILQGQVQQIALMKGKGNKDTPGLLQIVQQVIGSAEYAQRLDQILSDVEAKTVTEAEISSALSFLERHLVSIPEQKISSVLYYNHLKKTLCLSDINIQTYMHVLKKDAVLLSDLISSIRQQRKEHLNMLLQQKRDEQKTQCTMTNEDLNIKYKDMVKKVAIIDGELKKIADKDKFFKEQMKTFIPQLQGQMNKITQVAVDQQQHFNSVKRSELLIPEKRKQLILIDRKIKYFQNKLRKDGKNADIPTEYSYNQKRLLQFRTKSRQLIDEKSKIQQKIQQIQQTLRRDRQDKVQKEQQIQELKKKKQMGEQVIKKINEKFQQIKENNAKNANKNKSQKQQFENLKILLDNKKSLRNGNIQKNKIAQVVKQANIPGVLGRLGDLGTCQPQFQQIITTSTPQLDNIVVTHYEAAQKVLDLVKRQRIGKVTCIILDKIKDQQQYMNRGYNVPENTVLLFNKIRPVNNDAKIAFFSAIKFTLYVKDQQQANNVAFNSHERRRVVTVGKTNNIMIIQRTGVMSSFPKKKSGFGSNFNNKQNEEQIQAIQEKLRKMRELFDDEKNPGLQEFKAIEKQHQFVESQTRTFTIQIQKLSNSIFQNTTKRINSNEGNLKELSKKLQSMNNNLNKMTEEAKLLERKNLEMRSSIIEKIGHEVFFMKQLIEKQKNDKKLLEGEIRMTENRMQGADSLRQTFKKQKQSHYKKINIMVKQFNKLKLDRRAGITKASELFEKRALLVYKFKIIYQASMLSSIKVQIVKEIDNFKMIKKRGDKALKAGQSNKALQQITTLTDHLMKKTKQYNKASVVLNTIRSDWKLVNKQLGFLDKVIKMSIFGESIQANDEIFNITSVTSIIGKNSSFESNQSFQIVQTDKKRTSQQLDIMLTIQKKAIVEWKQQLKNLRSSQANSEGIYRFRQKYRAYDQKIIEMEKLTQSRNILLQEYRQLFTKRIKIFRQGFKQIRANLKSVYTQLSIKGDVDIVPINRANPFKQGLAIRAKPPRKHWKQMNKLSGGEKTLTSLSLIFALHQFKPSPIYLMDEIDAALDIHNASTISKYIVRSAKYCQFVVVSLRPQTFLLCDDLVGIMKFDDMTRVVTCPAYKVDDDQDDQKETAQNYQQLRMRDKIDFPIAFENGTRIGLENRQKLDIQQLWNSDLTTIVKKVKHGWRVLSDQQRTNFLIENIISTDSSTTDSWLQKNGWYWFKVAEKTNNSKPGKYKIKSKYQHQIPWKQQQRNINLAIIEQQVGKKISKHNASWDQLNIKQDMSMIGNTRNINFSHL